MGIQTPFSLFNIHSNTLTGGGGGVGLGWIMITMVPMYFVLSSFGDILGIELRDAVNEVMKVSYTNIHNLGRNLGLDEDRIQDLLSLAQSQLWPEEKRQRLVELWFREDPEPSWEKLHEALKALQPARQSTSLRLGESSSISMDSSVPVISPSLTSKIR